MALRGYKNTLPEMLTILAESTMRAILLASRAIYSCIPPKNSHPILLLLYIWGFVCHLTLAKQSAIVSDCSLPFFSIYKQAMRSARMRRASIVGQYLGHRIFPQEYCF